MRKLSGVFIMCYRLQWTQKRKSVAAAYNVYYLLHGSKFDDTLLSCLFVSVRATVQPQDSKYKEDKNTDIVIQSSMTAVNYYFCRTYIFKNSFDTIISRR